MEGDETPGGLKSTKIKNRTFKMFDQKKLKKR
jgi:hypothetical protein